MLNSRQRAQLRGMANQMETILHIGKGGVTENVIAQANSALEARELIKGRVLENSLMSAREAAEKLARLCRAETVFTIGSRFVLYRESRSLTKEKRIKLVD
jgi:RNA-binding protein